MLEYIVTSTMDFLEEMPKSVRKKKGQFFTSLETARFMANMFDVELLPNVVSVLDPGCGSGFLSAALVERLQNIDRIQKINLERILRNKQLLR